MKAIVLQPGTKNLRLAEWPEPQIQSDHDIKAKVLRVGICGTDREEAAGGRADAPEGEKELVIGHEMLSQVVEVGKGVKKVKKGDFVVFTVRRGCGLCEACKAVRSDMCMSGQYTERGIKGRHGFHAEYVVDEEQYAIKVPASIADIAVLAEPMSVVEKAIDEAGIIQTARLPYLVDREHWLKGKTAIVAGLGPIGLLGALILRLRGATVLGLDRKPDSPRVKLLQAMGGVYIDDKNINFDEFLEKYPKINMILDAAGVAQLDFDLLDCLGINGIFVLTGVPGDQHLLSLNGAKLMRKLVLKNQVMVGSVNESIAHFEKGIADLEAASAKWPGVVQKIITHKFPYTDFETAFTQHTADEIKVIIEWSQK
ncbi:MAG: glucose 1-dehydrogenase [Verrucomicrobia bacterium]|nr:glucose 1-dehydrogenase [Verrucomicrobiota bacterium]